MLRAVERVGSNGYPTSSDTFMCYNMLLYVFLYVLLYVFLYVLLYVLLYVFLYVLLYVFLYVLSGGNNAKSC